ncbi:MAG: carboxypeptidase-like regulatory domain-containing protein, partial [Bacteroidales bacterium]|nr:carboxypeptidase-like regulatory domain-containing protein [Bacteroidales bacterium]
MTKANLIQKLLRSIFLILISFVMIYSANAQGREISGIVSDAQTGESLIGVNVQIQGTTVGTVTNVEGGFTIAVETGQSLVFSYIGYETQTVEITDQITLEISLSVSFENLDEVVVVGYGTMKRSDLTGAVSSVNEEDIAAVKSANAIEALQGKVAGMDMVRSSGRAGSGYNILLRGARSLTASNAPLYIVDGV